jgi:aspartate carbamoyltransferase catalytic subunit
LKDTARNLEALNTDIIIIRHSAAGAPHFLARVLEASVINAGDGAHEHPTQAMLDAFTILEKKGRIAGLNVTILGDILYSRVARSNIWLLTKLGAKVTLCGPSTLVPKVFEQMGCRVTYNLEEAITSCCASSTSASARPCFPAPASTPASLASTPRAWPESSPTP